MKCRAISFLFFVVGAACAGAMQAAERRQEKPFDPLQQITAGFPKSIKLKNNGKLLEFCPDNTCDGFIAKEGVAVTTLRDFAYLYVYFFSDYTYLEDWRATEGAKKTALRVLAKPQYRNCKKDTSRESARCALLDLSRNGKIKLLFIRYDEGQRNVVHESIAKELSENTAVPKQ